jgi:hypothetical protein
MFGVAELPGRQNLQAKAAWSPATFQPGYKMQCFAIMK